MERPLRAVERAPELAVVETDRSSGRDEIDAQICALLVRIAAEERLAEDALPGSGDFFGWPSWSMDTGLTPAQERFVEHWSPQRILDSSRSVRQLRCALQRWSRLHRRDVDLDEALSTFATLQAR